jgi:putative addiction module CopG family antidote
MRSTQQFSVTLPNEMATLVRAKVQSGEYASESEVIREGLRALNARERAMDDWLRKAALSAYDTYRADPSRGLSLEEVRASIGKRSSWPWGVTTHRIVVAPEARDQLDDLHTYISIAADSDTATGFIDGILDYISTLREFPNRGTPRDDIKPGLRTIAWRRRVTIAYIAEAHDVVVIGVFYGGRDFEALLSSTDESWNSDDRFNWLRLLIFLSN